MATKNNEESSEYLISNPVYTATTEINSPSAESEIDLTSFSSTDMLISKRSFERRGLLNVIASTIIVTLILLTYAIIHVTFTQSYFISPDCDPSTISSNSNSSGIPMELRIKHSSWKTTYDLPDNVTLLEIYSNSFDFATLSCPNETFALVLNIENSTISKAEEWIEDCGELVRYFRINSEYDTEDVNRIIRFVPNAQYIPIKASFTAIPGAYDILSDKDFQNKVAFEWMIINSLVVRGSLTSTMMSNLNQIVPFVDELTIEGSNALCSTLRIEPRATAENCAIYWDDVKKLKLHNIGNHENDCFKMYQMIDMCWKMRSIEHLEVKGSFFDVDNVKLLETFIDTHRITSVNFVNNNCTLEITQNRGYICGWPDQ